MLVYHMVITCGTSTLDPWLNAVGLHLRKRENPQDSFIPLKKRSYINWLVVEPTPLQNMEVNWDDYSQYMEK